MNQTVSYVELGGTLFVPIIHKDLLNIAISSKYPALRSMVIDTEDGISEAEYADAIKILQTFLKKYEPNSTLVFARPRNIETLQMMLALDGIEKIAGFVLPKISTKNLQNYIKILKHTNHHFMPSIESKDMFEVKLLQKIRDTLLPYVNRIPVVRFGLEDMLKQLVMSKECQHSVFDIAVLSSVVTSFITIFKPHGFHISGGVYKCFEDIEGLKKDILRDMQEGLFSKTIIHPNQIDPINQLYKVSKKEYLQAKKLLETDFVGVYNQENTMIEVATMTPYAKQIFKRAEVYGVSD